MIFLLLSAFVFIMADTGFRFFSVGKGSGTFGDFAQYHRSAAPQTGDFALSFMKTNNLRVPVFPTDTILPADSVFSESDVDEMEENDTSEIANPPQQTREASQLPDDTLRAAISRHNKAIEDSIRLDSINKKKANGIEAPIEYKAEDSIVYLATSKTAYLYGSSSVKYQNMDLESDRIQLSLDSNLVRATGSLDTLGKVQGKPVFKWGSDTYENDTMAFNMKTKKGIIRNVYTQQEDGYLTSQKAKRNDEGVLFLEHGRYTTCDEPHPDFYIALSRARVRPGKDVVFGPAHLVVCDVPLPLAIPYGFFPFTKSYSSGFIMPTYGDESSRGFYLRDIGYYFAISDKMDLKLLGEIYTKGSWGFTVTSNYVKRYKYRGSFLFSYQDTKNGDKGMPDFTEQESFKINWQHSQDQKANPFRSFTASVNFTTSSYERNNLTSMYNPAAMTQSTRTSSVHFQTQFSSLGMSLSSTMNINQNMRDSSVTMTMPDINVSVSRFAPFKRKHAAGAERWYEKIFVQYTGQMSNSISTKENKLMHSNLLKDWRNGIQHSIPVSASFTVLKNFIITPNISFTDRMYVSKERKSWNAAMQTEVTDTVRGFYNVYDWNMGIQASTTLYGFWTPIRKIFGDKIQVIRHVLTPQISYNYAPDFGASRYGYWETYQKTDENGNVSLVEYSPYQGMLYGFPSRGKTGSITVDLRNNLEMKVLSDKDTSGVKKVSLIDELGLNMSYNMAAKKQPWSNLSTRIRLRLTKSYTFNMNAQFATYAYELDKNGKPYIGDRTEYSKGRFGRFMGMTQNFSVTLSPENIKKWLARLRGEGKEEAEDDDSEDKDDDFDTGADTNIDENMVKGMRGSSGADRNDMAETDADGYMRFSLPWSLSIGYGINMRENTGGKFNTKRMRYPYKFTHTLNLSGFINLSDGWKIDMMSGYDFENHAMSMTTLSLNRDLHCFNMSCQVVLAPYTSYNFSFRCNAATLTDALKYDKRSGASNSVQWY